MEDFFRYNKRGVCILITVIVTLVLLLVVLLISVDTVEPTEYALKYSSISRKPDYTFVYTGGWYIIGPFNKFLTFPATEVNLDFANLEGAKSTPITTTVEQSSVTISFSLQYKLIKDQIPNMYRDQNMKYENKIITVAKSINEVSSSLDITIDGFWTNRTYVEKQIQEFLDSKFESSAFSNCVGF